MDGSLRGTPWRPVKVSMEVMDLHGYLSNLRGNGRGVPRACPLEYVEISVEVSTEASTDNSVETAHKLLLIITLTKCDGVILTCLTRNLLAPTSNHTPGSVGLFQMDGADYTQSTALLRYAGRLGGLYPEDPLAALKVRM